VCQSKLIAIRANKKENITREPGMDISIWWRNGSNGLALSRCRWSSIAACKVCDPGLVGCVPHGLFCDRPAAFSASQTDRQKNDNENGALDGFSVGEQAEWETPVQTRCSRMGT